MQVLKIILFLIFLTYSTTPSFSQTDSTKIIAQIKKINELFETKVDSCKPLIIQSISESTAIQYNTGTARLYLLLTQYYILKGNPDSALFVLPALEKAAKNCADKKLNINIFLKMALLYSDLGEFKNAIDKAILAQKLAESTNDYRLLSKVNHDLGFIYTNKSLYKNALNYFKKGLEYAILSKDTFSVANLNARIGGNYNYLELPDSGLYYNQKALKYFESLGIKRGIGVAYNNIAGSYDLMKNYSKAIEYYKKAIPIRKELGDDYAITIINYNLGVSYLHLKQYPVAEEYLQLSLKENRKQKDYPQILEALKQLCVLYDENNKLNMYKDCANEYMTIKDSLTESENIKAIGELQEKYESEKKEKNIVLLTKENEKQESIYRSERKNKFVILISSGVSILTMTIFSFFLYKRFKVSQKQKNIIQQQKHIVDEKNLIVEHQKNILEAKQKEILDSIHYAKRIQSSLLPTQKYIDKSLNRLKNDIN